MIQYFASQGETLREVEHEEGAAPPSQAVWIDLYRPTTEEETELERRLGIEIPTREEMSEIETSSRLYRANGNLFLTAVVICRSDSANPQTVPVTFILTKRHLITVRYDKPRSFHLFKTRCQTQNVPITDAQDVLVGLLSTIVDRAADILERIGLDLDRLSKEIFKHTGNSVRPLRRRDAPQRRLEQIIEDVGHRHDITVRLRDSLQSLERLLVFFKAQTDLWDETRLQRQVQALEQDVASLRDYDSYLSGNVDFMLNATLGLVGIQQNNIIKIFSVVAVIFLPPTLVASIYGMNFHNMPELDWTFGYPLALCLQVLSAVLPYFFFRWRGWL